MPTNEEVRRAMSPAALKQQMKANPTNRHLHVEGGLAFAPLDTKFDQRFPHSFCNLCGAIYQSDLDRIEGPDFKTRYNADSLRSQWRHKHSNTHSLAEHIEHMASGRKFTAIATYRLAQAGIYPITDAVLDDEVQQAAETAPRFNHNINDDLDREASK